MAPLPPRPKSDTPVQKSEEYLSEKTLLEQQAGKEALERSKQQHEAEQEAGRKSVELNQQRVSRKA